MGLFSSLFNPGKAYRKAQEQMQNYYNQAQGYLAPYAQQGQQAYGNLSNAMQSLLNPADLYNQFAESYTTSPAAQNAIDMAMQYGMNSASSLGLLGSTPALSAMQSGAAAIQAQDRERYLDRLINQYMQGANLAQGIYGQGAQVGSQMGQNALNMGQNAAQLAYGQQAAPGQLFGNLLGIGANLAGSYMGMKGMNNLANSWKTTGG